MRVGFLKHSIFLDNEKVKLKTLKLKATDFHIKCRT